MEQQLQPYFLYVIRHKTNTELGQYIGSTSNFSARKYNHRCFCKKGRHYNGVYELIKNNGGWEEWEITVLETRPTHEEIVRLENEYIRNTPNILNKRIACVENYAEYKREAQRKYYYKNLERKRRESRERYHRKKDMNNINDSSTNQITSEGQTI